MVSKGDVGVMVRVEGMVLTITLLESTGEFSYVRARPRQANMHTQSLSL